MKIIERNKIDDLNTFEKVILKGIDSSKKINIAIAVDTSSSINELNTRKVLNSIKNILIDKEIDLSIWCFDTEVQLETVKEITSKNLSILEDYKFLGFGGSSLDKSFHYANTNHSD